MRMSFNKKRNRRASQTAESELSNDGKSESLHPYSSIMLGTVGGSYIWCSSCKVCNITAVYYHYSVFLTRIKLTSVAVPAQWTSIYSNNLWLESKSTLQ